MVQLSGALRVTSVREAGVWRAALERTPHADLLQSWEWGEFKRQSAGWEAERVLVLRGEEPVAGVQVLARRVLGIRSLYAPRGPWWCDDDALATLVGWLRRRYRLRAPFLRMDPPVTEAAALQALGARLAPRQVQPRATIVVDLTPAPEEILAGFDRQVRYNVRLAERKGVEVVQGGRAQVAEFYELLAQTAERKGFPERALEYFTTLVEQFGEAAPVFLARYEGRTIYGAIVVQSGRAAYYLYGASGGDRSVKPSEFVQYRAMLWARARGAVRYDMWGIPAHAVESNPLYGVYRFKSGFGGKEEQYPGALDLPLIPLLGWAPAQAEVLLLKTLSLAHGDGFRLVDHLA